MPRPKPLPNTHCATCGAGVYRSPSKLQNHEHHYCDQTCRDHHTIVWIGFVHANFQTMTVKEIAAHIGIPPATLRTWVFNYNKWGLKIAFKKGPPVPDGIGCRERARIARQAARNEKPVKEPKTPKVKKQNVTIYPSNHGKPPKKDPVQFKTKVVPFDPTLHRMIKVDNRTWKQVPIDNNKKTA